jgi:glutathione S-transferase
VKIFYAAPSPFVRKCLVTAHELGLRERIELAPAAAHPVNRDPQVVARNPLGKIPTLVTDEGVVLFDSRVICEYLNELGGGRLIPATGAVRWRVLADQALADGIMDAAILIRYESAVRPESLRWNDWIGGQMQKVTSGLDEFERRADDLGGRVDLGTIALGCALGYLDFRFAPLAWRSRYPLVGRWLEAFGRRESMLAAPMPAA